MQVWLGGMYNFPQLKRLTLKNRIDKYLIVYGKQG